MIKPIPCICNYCKDKVFLFWILSLLPLDFDTRKTISFIIKFYDDEFMVYYQKNIKEYKIVLRQLDMVFEQIIFIKTNLNKLSSDHDGYNHAIANIFDQRDLYTNMFNLMDEIIDQCDNYLNKFDSYENELRKQYEIIASKKNLYIQIKSQFLEHTFWPRLTNESVDEISNNTQLLNNCNNEIIRSYIIQRFNKEDNTLYLEGFLRKCKIDTSRTDKSFKFIFVINNDNRKTVLDELARICRYCKNSLHKSSVCRKRHCYYICAKSYTRINEDCLECKSNLQFDKTTECQLLHCGICFHHHSSDKCPFNHCWKICTNNGKWRKNCKDCEFFDSKSKTCLQDHCSICNHHHKTIYCKFQK